MDSSFLTWVNVGLAFYSGISFFKLIFQFGLPNHPARFMSYLVMACSFAYFGLLSATGLGVLPPWLWLKWYSLPLIAGGLGFLLQIVGVIGHFSRIQRKVMSRLPLIGGLLCVGFFSSYSEFFFLVLMLLAAAFLIVSVGKVRLLKRYFFKMALFLALTLIGHKLDTYWFFVWGQLSLFAAFFYFNLCEQIFCLSSKIEDFQSTREGVSE
ncbi:MAG: hypothetical protein AB7I27_05560 [Bacteriovoracaceae bacterium]